MTQVSVVLLLSLMTSFCVSDIFTSSDKIMELAQREIELLDALQFHINNEYDNLKTLSGFLAERSKATRTSCHENRKSTAEHPNGAFHLIKLYTQDWQHLVAANPVFANHVAHLKQQLPTDTDYAGACSAIVRLHRVYKLRVSDMFSGNFSGYLGPPLSVDDAFDIGRQAFVDGFLKESSEWLTHAVTEGEHSDKFRSSKGQAYSLLGRTYFFMNDSNKARELYQTAVEFDTVSGDVLQLQKELTGEIPHDSYGNAVEEWHESMSDLCRRHKDQRVGKLQPYHLCRYKRGLYTPYLAYKEEILSEAPYASVFYDIVSDAEIRMLTDYIKGRMFRGLVGMGPNATTAVIRTSDLGWIYDDEMPLAREVSMRVKGMTGLEVDQRVPHGPSSSEAFQVVNYGMGGHYDVHMDPFDQSPDDILLNRSGERLATFLIYLSDVEKGGHTVFVQNNLSVAPQKGMALFWYNFDTTMEKDLRTHHAGCPVLIGHKWIINKWIWTYGNTFRRRCGLLPSSTQRDIEPLMYAAHRECLLHDLASNC